MLCFCFCLTYFSISDFISLIHEGLLRSVIIDTLCWLKKFRSLFEQLSRGSWVLTLLTLSVCARGAHRDGLSAAPTLGQVACTQHEGKLTCSPHFLLLLFFCPLPPSALATHHATMPCSLLIVGWNSHKL